MRVGEIKAHSIMLMFPEIEISYDRDSESSLVQAIENLRCDPNVCDVMRGIVPSINRALSIIEKRGGTNERCVKKTIIQKQGTRITFKLDDIAPDIYKMTRVFSPRGADVSIKTICDGEICFYTKEAGEYTFVYKARAKKITQFTSDFSELDLNDAIAEIIPYFVKGDLMTQDNMRHISSILFDGLLNELLTKETDKETYVESVYSQG